MKVFCSRCKFYIPSCYVGHGISQKENCEKTLKNDYNYRERYRYYSQKPKDKNKNNDCNDYKKKWYLRK